MRPPKTVGDSNQYQNNYDFYTEIRRLIGQVIEVTSTVAADTEFSVAHGLGRVPTNVQLLVKQGQTDAYISIRPGATAWTDKLIYLDCSEANAEFRIRVT